MANKNIRRGPAAGGAPSDFTNRAVANDIYVDGLTDILTVGKGASGVLSRQVSTVAPFATLAADGAIPVTPGITQLTKGSAGAYTLAAPGTAGIGAVLTFTTGSDFAHVVTFTGSTLRDGTTGAKITWTAAAFTGSSITVVGISATLWAVVSKNLGTVA